MGAATSHVATLFGVDLKSVRTIEPRLIDLLDSTAVDASWPQEKSSSWSSEHDAHDFSDLAIAPEECETWSDRVVEFVETNARQAALDNGACRPYRALADFFKGQASLALRGLARCPEAYGAIQRSLAKSHSIRAWRDLASYSHAELQHAAKEGNWDPRVFPELANKSVDEIYGKRDHTQTHWRSRQVASLVSEIRVVTTASEERPQLDVLRASCRAAGLSLDVLGLEHDTIDGYSHDWKHRLLAEYLHSVPDSVGVLVVDAYDVVISQSAKSILLSTNASIVFSTELDCWPDSSVCRAYPIQSRLNSGSFYGLAPNLRAMLHKMERDYGAFMSCGNDDQRAYQRYAIDYPDLLDLDLESRVFQTMHGYNWTLGFDDEGLPQLFDANFPNKAITPAVMHFNSHDGKAMYDTFTQALNRVEPKRIVPPKTFIVSLAGRAPERRESIVRALDRAGLRAHFVNAVDGDTLYRSASHEPSLVARWQSNDGIHVRAFDWTDPLLGGDAMSEEFTKRVIACTLSHLKAIAAANVTDQWPALILEDDVDLTWMPSERDIFSAYVPENDDEWTIVQLASLIGDPYLAADLLARRCALSQSLVRRSRCAPPERHTGAQAYLVSKKGAHILLERFAHNAIIDLTSNGTLNFAADYLLYNLDGVYISTQPVTIEVPPSRSTIGIGHDRLAHATRALSTAILRAPCDSAVVAASRFVVQDGEAGSIKLSNKTGMSVLVGDTLVSRSVVVPQQAAQSILAALKIVDPKVVSLLTQALAQCSNSCLEEGNVIFPSPLRCFSGRNSCDSPETCNRLGLQGANCATFCGAMSALQDVAQPCGESWCTKVSTRNNPLAEGQPTFRLSNTNDPRAFADFARQLASLPSITPTRRILFASVADAWDALDRVVMAHNATFLDLDRASRRG